MSRSARIAGFIVVLAVLSGLACTTGAREEAKLPTQENIDPALLMMFGPLPAVMESPGNPLTEEKISLGRMLYYDGRLSSTGEISCNSCHDLEKYGVDGEPVSDGVHKKTGDRNSPTVYNAAGHFVQFWDGRAPHVEEQAKGPVTNPVEMAMPSGQEVVDRLKAFPGYVEAFRAAFPDEQDPVTFENVALAIGAFERKLVTPGRWDKFLAGDAAVLTGEEKAGFQKYVDVGCQACHMGVYVGGSMYQKMGAVKPWIETKDLGRYRVTKREEDRLLFKVPSLRNVEKTAPYYHTGAVATLEEAIKMMGEYQLGRELSDEDVRAVVVWLKTLTGEIPRDYIRKPALPS